MDQSTNPLTVVDEKRREEDSASAADHHHQHHHHEQHVSFADQHHHEHRPPPPPVPVPYEGGAEEEEEEVDEDEEARAFEQRLLEARQRNQGEHSSPPLLHDQVSGAQHHHPLASSASPPDSMDLNDFVKLEKPHDLFNTNPHAHPHPEVEVHLVGGRGGGDEEITPSDDVAPPVGDDLSDFAASPQDAAHDLADRTHHHQTLEQFLATGGDTGGTRRGQGQAEAASSSMHHGGGETTTTSGGAHQHRVAFDDDDDEDTFRRHGPLTLGQPMGEVRSLHQESDRGFTDHHHHPEGQASMTGAVGDFASRITQDAKDGALKTKEVMEHGAWQAKEAFDEGATRAKKTTENLLDFGDDDDEGQGQRGEENVTVGERDGSPPRSFSLDQPDTPHIPVRPPTPPKPREADAPATPPVLDLGGPTHPHVYPPSSSYQRKPSLKMTPGSFGISSSGAMTLEPIGDGRGKRSSWFDIRRWDKNVLDLIYWRDPKKSGVVFGATLALLICLATCNIISVVSYVGLLVLTAAFGFRAYNYVTAKKGEHKNPFQPYLEQGVDLPQDRVHEQVDVVLKHTKEAVHHLRRLFFVEDICDTLKFALLLWALTYVGAHFSGMALIILAFVGLFTLPKVYELYQPQIDHYYGMVESKVKQASDVAHEHLQKVPFFKKQQKVVVEKEE